MPIVLYSRRGCHLCECAEEWLALHAPGAAVIDIDGASDLVAAFGTRVPVVEADGVVLVEGRFDEADLVAAIRRD